MGKIWGEILKGEGAGPLQSFPNLLTKVANKKGAKNGKQRV